MRFWTVLEDFGTVSSIIFFSISPNLGHYWLKSIFEALCIYKMDVMVYEIGKMRKLNI